MKELKKDKIKIKKFKKLKRKFWLFVILLNLIIAVGSIYFLVLLFKLLRS